MPGRHSAGRRPGRADGDAKQDRQHQRLDIGLADEAFLDDLKHEGEAGDEAAEEKARHDTTQAMTLRHHAAPSTAALRGASVPTLPRVTLAVEAMRYPMPARELMIARGD